MNLVLTPDLLVKCIATLLQPFNLTRTSEFVLIILADSESSLLPNEIADWLIVSRVTVTGLLDSLERQAYIRRLSHPSDGGMILVEIAETGRKTTNDFRAIVHQQQDQWLEVLRETEEQQ